MILGMQAMIAMLGKGIFIDPFCPRRVNTSSYDVSVGPWFFRQHDMESTGDFFFNPYCKAVVARYYGEPKLAPMANDISHYDRESEIWQGIEPWHRVIVMQPGEMILGCTLEFIGGTRDPESGRCFTTEMRARSSVGRVGLEVCRCAGWGDVGYINRWTLEIVSTGRVPIPLVVANVPEDVESDIYEGPEDGLTGTRLAQIVFHETTPVAAEDLYGSDGRSHYQEGSDLEKIKRLWRPELLLPKLTTK